MFSEETLQQPTTDGLQNEATTTAPQSNPIRPQTAKKKYPRRNIKRPPPSHHSPLRPRSPTETNSVRSQPPSTEQPPTNPTVTPQTMRGAGAGSTSRFHDFMPTPRAPTTDARRLPLPQFKPPPTTNFSNGGSSCSSNSIPNN